MRANSVTDSSGKKGSLEDLIRGVERRLRVLNGPLQGATYPVWSGMRMGRRSSVDVLVRLPELSREHAQLVADPFGGHWLVDLASSNGTWVGDRRVVRHLLQPGTVFRLAEVAVIYEEEPPVHRADGTSDVAAVSYRHAPHRRSTTELPAIGELSEPLAATSIPPMRSTDAVGPDGRRYAGCLVEDLAEYRDLRLRRSSRALGTTDGLDHLERLERALRAGQEDSALVERRSWATFSCRVPAGLRSIDGSSVSVIVVGLGVGGAEIFAPRPAVGVGEVVWLAFELLTADWSRTLVLTARVSRIERERLELTFIGVADDDEHDDPQVRTRVDPIDEPDALRLASPSASR